MGSYNLRASSSFTGSPTPISAGSPQMKRGVTLNNGVRWTFYAYYDGSYYQWRASVADATSNTWIEKTVWTYGNNSNSVDFCCTSDESDYIHVVYIGPDFTGLRYTRGTPSDATRLTYTWSTPVNIPTSPSISTASGDMDITVHKDPLSSGWIGHGLFSPRISNTTGNVNYFRWTIAANGTTTMPSDFNQMIYNSATQGTFNNVSFAPSITHRHNGDGKTVATVAGSLQPDVFITHGTAQTTTRGSNQGNIGQVFRKITWNSNGTWTVQNPIEVDNSAVTLYQTGGTPTAARVMFDGVHGGRAIVAGTFSGINAAAVYDIDITTTTGTTTAQRTLSGTSFNNGYEQNGGNSFWGTTAIDAQGNVYFWGVQLVGSVSSSPVDARVTKRVWRRGNNTFAAYTVVPEASGQTNNTIPYPARGVWIWGGYNTGKIQMMWASLFGSAYRIDAQFYDDNLSAIGPNTAPLPAQLLFPVSGQNVQQGVIVFSWAQRDNDLGDAQSRADLRIRERGTSTWTVYNNVSTDTTSTYSLAANSLTVGKSYEYSILTYDAVGTPAQDWAPSSYFTMVPSYAVTTNAEAIITSQHSMDQAKNGIYHHLSRYAGGNGPVHYTTNLGTDFGQFTGPPLFSANQNHAYFLDDDDNAHALYRDNSGNWAYARGVPNSAARTTYTWSQPSTVNPFTAYPASNMYFPQVIAHRHPNIAGGWYVHLVAYVSASGPATYVVYNRIIIAANGTFTYDGGSGASGTQISSSFNSGFSAQASMDFRHTGNGKTVATVGGNPQPDVMIGWSTGTSGTGQGLRTRKLTWTGSTYSLGVEQSVDTTNTGVHYNASSWGRLLFDGTRWIYTSRITQSNPVVHTLDDNGAFVSKSDAGSWGMRGYSTTTNDPIKGVDNGGAAYDTGGNLYWIGQGGNYSNPPTNTTFGISLFTWNRATDTWVWRGFVQHAVGGIYFAVKRNTGIDGRLTFWYQTGSANPYQLNFQSIATGSIPNIPALTTPAAGSVLDIGGTNTFAWTFSDNDANDTQSAFDFQYRAVGSSTYTTISQTTPNTFVVVPANALPSGGGFWRVQYYDSTGLASGYSPERSFSVVRAVGGIRGNLANVNLVIRSAGRSTRRAVAIATAAQIPTSIPSYASGGFNVLAPTLSASRVHYGGSALAYNGKMYCYGGYTNTGTNAYDNTMDIYDPATNTWTAGTSGGTTNRYNRPAAVVGTKLYFFGGTTASGGTTQQVEVDIYDVSTNTWSSGTPIPANRNWTGSSPRTAVVGTNIYLGPATWSNLPYASVVKYDTLTGLYSLQTTWPANDTNGTTGLYATAFTGYNGKIYGYGGVQPSSGLNSNQLYSYDPATNTYVQLANGPRADQYGQLVNIRTKLVYIGGAGSGNTLPATLIYDIPSNTWESSVIANQPTISSATLTQAVGIGDQVILSNYVNGAPSQTAPGVRWSVYVSAPYLTQINNLNNILTSL